MARKGSGIASDAGWPTSFSIPSDALWATPPRRSWPYPPTPLEQLAVRVGVSDEQLRDLLREEIQARLRTRGESWDSLDRVLERREHGR